MSRSAPAESGASPAPLRRSDGRALSAAALGPVGPILLVRHRGGTARYEPRAEADIADARGFLAIYMVVAGQARWSGERDAGICRAGEVLLIDAARSFTIADDDGLDSLVVLVPRSYLLPVVDAFPCTGVYPAAGSFAALRSLAEQLFDAPRPVLAVEAELLAAALRHLIAAALVAIGQCDQIRSRRQTGLLDRCLAAIDARPHDPLGIAALCGILGCSRSSLYRAAAPVGGIAEMVARRRLSNVHRALRDPSDPRSIAAIAEDHGFVRPAQFGRQFKRVFGATAGTVRASAALRGGGFGGAEPTFADFRTYLDAFGVEATVHDDQGPCGGRSPLHDR